MSDNRDRLVRFPDEVLRLLPDSDLVRMAEECQSTQDLAALMMRGSQYADTLKPVLLKKMVRGTTAPVSYRGLGIQKCVTTNGTQDRDYLARMPAEILLHIAEDPCLSTRDLAAFARASRHYADVVVPALYKRNIREENANALLWAVMNERTGTLDLLIRNGADINNVAASENLSKPSPYRWIEPLREWDSHGNSDKLVSKFRCSSRGYDGINRNDDPLPSIPSFDQAVASYLSAAPASATPVPATTTIPASTPHVTAPTVTAAQPPVFAAPPAMPAITMAAAAMPAAWLFPPPMPAAPMPALPHAAALFAAPTPATFVEDREDVKRDFKYTPLALAIRTGLTRPATWLLEHGADTEVPVRDLCDCDNKLKMSRGMWRVPQPQPQPALPAEQPQWTALHLAVHYNHKDLVNLLISHGADTRQVCRPEDGPCTVFHTAFTHKRYSIISSLAYGLQGTNMVEINARGQGGITPLHIAYCMGDMKLVDIALKFGAYVNLEYDVDGNEWTLFSMACAKSDWPFALELLKKRGANPDFDLTTSFGARNWTTQSFLRENGKGLGEDFSALKDEITCLLRDQEVAWL
ncbi:hypothetical protein diail_1041 [Diaporthe ilicicola]|nr:hypothetical protein diail_1041 [Diaporthe ilicicola]